MATIDEKVADVEKEAGSREGGYEEEYIVDREAERQYELPQRFSFSNS